MTIKLTASALVLLVLAGWAPETTADRSDVQTAHQPTVVVESDLEVLILGPEPAEDLIERFDNDIELYLAQSPPSNGPRFLAEPEDPTKVRFIAEPEDPNSVCAVPIVDGHVSICDLSTETHPPPVHRYEPAP